MVPGWAGRAGPTRALSVLSPFRRMGAIALATPGVAGAPGYWGMVRRVLVAVVLAALGVTACGSDYAYVSNRGAGAYFKVPAGWEVYDEPEVLRARDASLSDQEADDLAESLWVRGFDSASDPAPEHVVDPAAGAPRG